MSRKYGYGEIINVVNIVNVMGVSLRIREFKYFLVYKWLVNVMRVIEKNDKEEFSEE